MLSSNASNYIEKTLSQSQSQLISKTYRGVEDEIVSKVNSYRLRISHVKEKLELLIKEAANTEDCTIVIKEINKTICYESQQNLEKLMSYLSYLSELKHTIPDFFHTPFLNSVFTRNFGSAIDIQKGLLQKNAENSEKLKKLIPSRNYLGIYIPNIEFKDIDSVLCFIILEEFLMLSNKDAQLKSDNLIIETNTDEVPQHISIFNPSFNILVAYSGEKEQHLYLLFLTDVLELMGPDSAEFPMGSRTEYDGNRKQKYSKALTKAEMGKTELRLRKYDNLKTSLPDISLEQTERFINSLDSDHDHKIIFDDVVNFAKKHKLVLSESTISEMFEEIFQRRSVIMESQRRNPVDAHEIYHAVRYKYKKDPETHQWSSYSRMFRETWLMLFKLVGIELPKHTLPPVKSHLLLCNFELGAVSNKTSTSSFSKTQPIQIREPKPEILKKQYKPEADILVQNTQNIMELYNDEREPQRSEDSNKNAFQTLVNAKFKDITRKSEYQTVEFDTQAYYNESLRLSKNPDLYLKEKVNPIFKYVPMRKDYVYQASAQEPESIKDNRSGSQSDGDDLDNSVEPNIGSKRVTMYSVKENPAKSIKSTKDLKQTTKNDDIHKMYGTLRNPTTLSSSLKLNKESPRDVENGRQIFFTSFKIPDNETLRSQVARLEPILDPYNPPKLHNFRNDATPEDKPPFMFTWKNEIVDVIKDPYAKVAMTQDALEKEIYERNMYEMKVKAQKSQHLWVRYFKQAPRERGFVDHKYPDFLEKGDYLDGYVRGATFIRPEIENGVPFKLAHRSLRKTDKQLTFGDDIPTKM